MGVLFQMVLLSFATILAALSAFILGGTVTALTKHHSPNRLLIQAAWGLPFATIAWYVVVFIGAMAANESRDRDPGFGDDYWCRLPNGYQMATIDVLHHARLKSQSESLPEIYDVQQLQLKDPYMFGSTDSEYSFSGEKVDSYFQLDLNTGKLKRFATLDKLEESGAKLGVKVELESVEQLYRRTVPTIDQDIASAVVWLPPALGLLAICFWTWRVRQHGRISHVAR